MGIHVYYDLETGEANHSVALLDMTQPILAADIEEQMRLRFGVSQSVALLDTTQPIMVADIEQELQSRRPVNQPVALLDTTQPIWITDLPRKGIYLPELGSALLFMGCKFIFLVGLCMPLVFFLYVLSIAYQVVPSH